ncbi:FAD-binding oxidoreductase [Mesorhizobium argentiipisi]|uniref:D-lactate dehydrogenase (cytochrome) n=1 Tax=Mesorhizobium argentiipisi TaxID=3015175 RepID=A0ABU8KA09_9HYPH
MISDTEVDTSLVDGTGIAEAVEKLRNRFGQAVSVNETIRKQHANITTWHPVQSPNAVFFPRSTDEVSEAVRICAEHNVPIIPFGAGTSLEGNVNAPFGGVSIDLSGMSEILAVNEEDMDCVVQAGVTRKQLNEYVKATGLFFPIDPGANATLGGMASTRASGTNAVRYGTMRENVLGLTVVMADGSIRKTGGRARKSAAGYDMTRLFVGAEGTLGVITELTVRLHGVPQAISSATCSFPDLLSACNAVISTIRFGLPIARIELLDEIQIRACNLHSKMSIPEQPTLFLEFHGTDAGVVEQVELFEEIAREWSGSDFGRALRPEDRSRLWQARHDVYWACLALRPGSKFIATDVCVPISRLGDCMVQTQKDILETGLVAPIVGHVGDGNFHVSVMADINDAGEMQRIDDFIGRLNLRAIEMEGTCTGEHGIGQGKRGFLLREHGDNVESMWAVKRALDPGNIMNPGKIFATTFLERLR